MGKRIERVPKKFRKDVERQLINLGDLVQKRRKAMAYTQEELAEEIDISIETLKAIEGGRRHPSLPVLLALCLCLEFKITFG